MKEVSWRRPYAVLTVSFAVALIGLLVFAVASSQREPRLRLTSGQPGGVYLPLGKSIAEVVGAGQEGLEVEVAMLDASIEPARLQFPPHDGAAQYFNRNEPGFLVRYAEVIGLGVSLLVAAYGLLRAGKKWLKQRQKDRIDAYYLELNRLLDRMLEPLDEAELVSIQKRLQAIRSAALHQLAAERLLPDESFRIYQTVLAEAGAQVRHKLQEVRRG